MSKKKLAELGHIVAVENTTPAGKQRSPNAASHFGVVWVWYRDKPIQLMLTDSDLKKCAERANQNPEDQIELYEPQNPLGPQLKAANRQTSYWQWEAQHSWLHKLFNKNPHG